MKKIIHLLTSTFRVKLSVKRETVDRLVAASTPDGDFFLLMILSVLIITFGLVMDNIFLVIGGMMVTPLLYPVLANALAFAIGDWKLLNRSLGGFLISCALSVLAAFLVSNFFFSITEITTGMIKNIEPRMEYFAIAVFARIAASITWVRPNLSAALPGVGVTATLVPPLAAMGMGFAVADLALVEEAALLFLLSFVGILIPSILIFFLMKFEKVEKDVEKAVKKEDKKLNPDEGAVDKIKKKVGMEE